MKKRAILVGLGIISKNYRDGILASPEFELAGVCDINPEAIGRKAYEGIPFFTDYKEAQSGVLPDVAVICAPPAAHFQLAEYFLGAGVAVLVEKPATLNGQDLDALISLAKRNKVFFDCVFHWQYGSEVLFLREYEKGLGKLVSATTAVFDPYTAERDKIKEDSADLGGVWFDSGVNILSMLSLFADIGGARLLSADTSFDTARNIPSYVNLQLSASGLPVNIVINWNTELNYKKSTFVYEKGLIDMYHTQQAVFLNGEKIFEDTAYPRLVNHYRNYFLKQRTLSNMESVHKVLFEINSKLK